MLKDEGQEPKGRNEAIGGQVRNVALATKAPNFDGVVVTSRNNLVLSQGKTADCSLVPNERRCAASFFSRPDLPKKS
jgi:hypothetical protein